MDIHSIIMGGEERLLPHISRIFSARWFSPAKTMVFVAIWMSFFGLNVWFLGGEKGPIEQQKMAILTHPYDPNMYQMFSETLYDSGTQDQAMYQLRLSEQYSGSSPFSHMDILGVSTDISKYASERDSYLDHLQQTYQFWNQMTINRPDYRDAYIQLASTAYHMGRFDEVTVAMDTALRLDPNNTTVLHVQEVLQ